MIEQKRYPNIIGRLLIYNVLVLVAFAALTTYHVVTVYPAAVTIFPVLLLSNCFVLWRAFRKGQMPPSSPDRLRLALKKLRGVAIIFSAAGLIEIVVLTRQRNFESMAGAAFGLLMVAGLWFLIYRLGKHSKTHAQQKG